MKVLLVFGTRPEAIKMAPVVRRLAKAPGIEARVAVTAQHREMLDQVLRLFDINPDYDLDLMKPGQGLTEITTGVLAGLKPVLEDFKPDTVLVHGDTTTTMAASLAAYYQPVFADFLAHTYDEGISHPEVWSTIKNDLPVLDAALARLQARIGD